MAAERPKWTRKELKRQQAELQRKVAHTLEGGSTGSAISLLREALRSGWPLPALEQALQRLLRGVVSARLDQVLQLCFEILSCSEESFSEATLSMLVAELVDVGNWDAAEAILQHAVSINHVKMRTLQPLLTALAAAGDSSRLQRFFEDLLHPVVCRRQARLNGTAVATLLRGFADKPALQEEVLTLLSKTELEMSSTCLDKISEALSCEELPGLRGEVVMRPLGQLRRLSPEASHVDMARRGAAALLKPETCRRLSERLEDGDGVGPTCFVDGPNAGYRGAVQRRQAAEGSRGGAGGKNFSREGDVEISNLHAAYFRHDQIEATMLHLRQLGEVPLLVMPERYIFAGDARAQKGPKKPLNSLVQSWLSGNSLFVVSDDEPDDAVWMFASLYGKTGDRGRYIVTRDKAANHRASIWGIDFGDSLQDLELERSFRRWSALYLRWHALSWDGCNHSGAVTVRIDGMPPLSTEIQQHEGIWYIPEATGARWLQISDAKRGLDPKPPNPPAKLGTVELLPGTCPLIPPPPSLAAFWRA
ncbi:unnamed protein product [Symbiodinium necroappetens]|uniref:Uncharacterized protein n=1 Tax=Symbiodinium necroappetens TaxID=1628268 RepID=A0A812S6X5_9DINO|nr:unnamed protein product [Symbiodinium necroappetens]